MAGPSCTEVSVTEVDPITLTITGIGFGADANDWRIIKVSNGEVMTSGTGLTASFSFVGEWNTQYQLQFQ